MELVSRKKYDAKIFLTPEAIAKINFLVGLAKKEVGWLGEVEQRDPDNQYAYTITDVHLFKQTVSAAETDIDSLALGEFFAEKIDIIDRIRFWGHSHVNMAVNPSGTDVNTIQTLQENGCEFFIMGIFNKKNEYRFDVYTDDFIFKNLEWHPVYPSIDLTYLKKEFDDKVKDWVYKAPQQRSLGEVKPYDFNYSNLYNPKYKSSLDSLKSTNTQKRKNRRDRLWSNRKQNNFELGETGTDESKSVGQGQNRGTQHPKPAISAKPNKQIEKPLT